MIILGTFGADQGISWLFHRVEITGRQPRVLGRLIDSSPSKPLAVNFPRPLGESVDLTIIAMGE